MPEPEAPAAEKQSIWKKEISFRKKSAPEAPVAVEAPTPVLEPAAQPPVRASGPGEGAPGEPGGSPATEAAAPVPASATEAAAPIPAPATEAAAPVFVPPAGVEPPAPVIEPPAPVLEPAAPSSDPQPVAFTPPTLVPEEPTTAPTRAVSWVDDVLAADPTPVRRADELEPPASTPAVSPPAPAAPVLPPLTPAQVAGPAAVLPPPVPEIAPQPQPPVIHPPVPASELPPLEEPAEKTPWWKKELSVRRKPKAEAVPAAATVAAAEAGPKTPWWKKEIGGWKKTAGAFAPKQPYWKKEFGRAKKPAAEPTAPGQSKQPKRRRELSLPSLPSFERRGNAKSLVGLKIGASQIAAARVLNNGHAEVVQVAREEIEPGIVVAGELRDPEALAEALKSFFKKHRLPKRGVRLGIANNRIGVRTFEIEGIDDPKQLTNAIKFRAQEALPIPIDEAVLDYQVLEETTNEEGQSVRKILLVVAYRDLVDRYVSACRKAGINLMGVDLEAFALLRALAAPREGDEPAAAALVAVSIGHERSTFAVSDGRVCEFTRVLEWGGSALSVALARTLDLTPSEVEPFKRGLSLDGTATPEGLTETQAAEALEAIRRQVQTFARELVSSLQFYQNQPHSLGIGEIVLTGGTAHLPGLAAELQRLIGVRVKVGDPLVRVKVGKRVHEPEQLGSLAVAIGLGIED